MHTPNPVDSHTSPNVFLFIYQNSNVLLFEYTIETEPYVRYNKVVFIKIQDD